MITSIFWKHKARISNNDKIIYNTLKYSNLDFMIDPKFRNANKLFIVSFKNAKNDPRKDSFD